MSLVEWLGSLDFLDVASGPFVRSSYHADEMAKMGRRGND